MGMLGVVEPVANVMSYVSLGIVGAAALWFLIWNFLGPEAKHPLDYFSNKLRTQPYIYWVSVLALVGIPVTVELSGMKATFLKAVPQLGLVMYIQGSMIMFAAFRQLSAAACMVAALLYLVVSATGTLAIVSINPPGHEPGWVFSAMFLVFHMLVVLVFRTGTLRHLKQDRGGALLPPGSEKLARLWDHITLKHTPVLFASSNTIFFILYKLDQGSYGMAFALTYSIVTILVLIGCCKAAQEDLDGDRAVDEEEVFEEP